LVEVANKFEFNLEVLSAKASKIGDMGYLLDEIDRGEVRVIIGGVEIDYGGSRASKWYKGGNLEHSLAQSHFCNGG
jgi:hypothetical protein